MVVLAAIVMLVMDEAVATILAAVVGVLAAAGVAVLLDLTLMRAVTASTARSEPCWGSC